MHSIKAGNTGCHEMALDGDALHSLRMMCGFERYGFKSAPHQRSTDFFLLRKDGKGLRFSTSMVDLAERFEVGVLHVEAASDIYRPEIEVVLPLPFSAALNVERLVLSTEFGDVDSGLVLTASEDAEIVVVSGAYPFTVEVWARPPLVGVERFEPEYDLDRYRRRALVS